MAGPEHYLHSRARFVVEEELARFLDGPARGRRVWDLGGGVPPLERAAPLPSVDRDPGTRPALCADLERLPFRAGGLEAAVSLAVLEHVRRPRRVVAAMHEALAPGAPLFLWVPFLHEVHGYPVDLWRFTDTGLRELMEGAGFETLECHARGLTGLSVILRHYYRFLLPPRPPARRLRGLGYALLAALEPLDRLAPLAEMPVGFTWIGVRPGDGGPGDLDAPGHEG